MNAPDEEVAEQLAAAALVHRARTDIDEAAAALAASPLDEDAAYAMTRALNGPRGRKARTALRRLQGRDLEAGEAG